jgi:aspartate aminotransferase
MVALQAILNPQEEVVFPAPYWVSYPEMAKLCGAVGVPVYPENGTFHPRLVDIEKAVSPYTKAIIVNSPNNPSGVMYSEQFIAEIVEFCERKGIWVLMDDIYHKLIFDGRHIISPYKYTEKDVESSKVIVINGIAKVYGMTGYRIGWAIAPREIVQIMTNVQAQTTSCVSLILQAGAEGALNGVQSVVEALRLQIQNNRDIIMSELNAFPGVRCHKPDGTFYCLPDFRAYNGDSVKLSEFLLKKALVVTVPGKEFGMEGHLRLSYAGTVKDVTDGLARIKWALDPNSANEIYIGDKKMVRDWL